MLQHYNIAMLQSHDNLVPGTSSYIGKASPGLPGMESSRERPPFTHSSPTPVPPTPPPSPPLLSETPSPTPFHIFCHLMKGMLHLISLYLQGGHIMEVVHVLRKIAKQ